MEDDVTIEERTEEAVEQSPEELLAVEDQLLAQLTHAAENNADETQVVCIKRPRDRDFEPLYFRVRGLGEAEDQEILKKTTKKRRNPALGLALEEETDVPRYRSLLIMRATTAFCHPVSFDESGNANAFKDVDPLWDQFRTAYNKSHRGKEILDKADIVDKILRSGEKEQVMEIIRQLSGTSMSDLEETAKN